MGKTELLADFEARFRKNRQQVMAVQDSVASMALYGYPLQKQLVLSYEKTLADLLGFTAASDSLEKCMAETSRLSYGMPEIDPARRVFIVYSDIERTTPSVYNAPAISRSTTPGRHIFIAMRCILLPISQAFSIWSISSVSLISRSATTALASSTEA